MTKIVGRLLMFHRVAIGPSSPQLEYSYCRPELSKGAWKQLTDHPTLSCVNVAIGQDAVESLKELAMLPNLRLLNIYVRKDADADFARALPRLTGVEWINWSSGRCGEKEARSLAKMSNLTSLVLQNNVELPECFLKGLAELTQLRRLVIHTHNTAYEPSKLLDVLMRLPALRHWPAIKNLDSAGLALLARQTHIRSLELLKIDPRVNRQKLTEFMGGLQLKQLFLDDDSLDELGFLANQDELESLWLDAGSLRGNQFSILASLAKLKELHIKVSRAEDLSLAPLGECPSLETVFIDGEMMAPRDLDALGRSRSIRSLLINAGYLDDAAADWLCRAESIVNVSLGRDSMLTDAGLRKLSAKERLESLDVGGFISREGVASLSSLTRLRRLAVRSPILTAADQKSLRSQLRNVPVVIFEPFNPLRGLWQTGDDGFLRRITDNETRKHAANLEGKSAPELRGEIVSKSGSFVDIEDFRGKVVLVDFWGLWCRACMDLMPLLSHLENKYGEEGLVIIGVHSQRGAEGLDEYLRSHAKAWPNIVDTDGTLANAYNVLGYPSLYVIDKAGRVQVALPHIFGLERALEHFLAE